MIYYIIMGKSSNLTDEHRKIIATYKDSPLKPKEIAKKLGLKAKAVGGYLHFLKHGNPFLVKQHTQQALANPTQEVQNPTENKPSPPEPAKTEVLNRPEQVQEKKEVKNMALEQSDLVKIQEMISTGISKTLPETTAKVVEETTKKLKQEEEAKQKEREKIEVETKVKDLFSKVKPDDLKTLCEQYPELCKGLEETTKKVEALEKKAKEKSEEHEPTHSTAKDYLECSTCGPLLLKTLAKMSSENNDYAKRVRNALKEAKTFDVFKKIEEEEKKVKEESKDDKEKEEKPAETTII